MLHWRWFAVVSVCSIHDSTMLFYLLWRRYDVVSIYCIDYDTTHFILSHWRWYELLWKYSIDNYTAFGHCLIMMHWRWYDLLPWRWYDVSFCCTDVDMTLFHFIALTLMLRCFNIVCSLWLKWNHQLTASGALIKCCEETTFQICIPSSYFSLHYWPYVKAVTFRRNDVDATHLRLISVSATSSQRHLPTRIHDIVCPPSKGFRMHILI